MKQKLNDSSLKPVLFHLKENMGELGPGILGKIQGPFFVPDGVSRNQRFYSKQLWEKVIASPQVQDRLKNRGMFGTISHEQEINDTALLEGKISHVITDLWIDDESKLGMGEALILDTPAGKILNTILRANAQLYTSSRAFGSLGENTSSYNVPKVNEDDFELETWDFVTAPGFLEAKPKIAESLQKLLASQPNNNNNNLDKENTMSEKLIEKLSSEVSDSKKEIGSLNEQLSTEQAKSKVLLSEREELRKKYDFIKKRVTPLLEYRKLGTPKDVNEALNLLEAAQKKLNSYASLGTPTEIFEVFKRFHYTLKNISELGGLPAIKKSIEGSIKVLESYLAIGTPTELAEVLNYTEKGMTDKRVLEKRVVVERLSRKLNIPAEKIAKLYPNMSEKEIIEFFSEFASKSTAKSEVYKKKVLESLPGKSLLDRINAPRNKSLDLHASSGSRLMAHFATGKK